MSKKKIRSTLLVVAFVLLIAGAVLHYQDIDLAWWIIGLAVIVYIIARVFMREKNSKKMTSSRP